MAKKLKVTQVRSLIGSLPKHKRTMKAIGFQRNQQSLIKEDTPQLRGMLHAGTSSREGGGSKGGRRMKLGDLKPGNRGEEKKKTDWLRRRLRTR